MKPEIWLVTIDATSNYSPKMVEKYGRIYDVYWFNRNEIIHCCEFTPSYYLNYVTTYCEKVPYDEELREQMNEELREVHYLYDDDGYYHCHYIDNLASCKLIDDFSTHDPEDYEDDLDDFVREWVRPHEYV